MTNRIENLLIASVSAILAILATVLIIQATAIGPLQRQVEKQNEVIIELAKIEKYRYSIENDFGKIKAQDSQILLSLDNKLDALNENDSISEVAEKSNQGILNRLFKLKKRAR